MPIYRGSSNYRHDSRGRLGILVVNLGTPDAPTPAAVRRYLAEFLWDPRVIEMSRPLWWLILHGVILRIRPRRSAHAYAQVWTPEGSPLLIHTRKLAAGIGTRLSSLLHDDVPVALGMTYGSPSIAGALETLREADVRRLIVLPLYPQYSGSTTGSVFDRVTAVLRSWRWVPELRFIGQYHDDDAYIDAVATSVQDHWRQNGRKHLLFSFHGLPERYLHGGDPYHCQCHKTARLVAHRLSLGEADWSTSFQSRVGREAWLQPYTDVLLREYARGDRRHVTVVCPGFAVDCLETLEEIALRNRADFLTQGGLSLDYVPALNEQGSHIELLAQLILRTAQGWPETNPALTPAMLDAQARASLELAQRRGAPR